MQQADTVLNIFIHLLSQKDWERDRSEYLSLFICTTNVAQGMQEKLFTYLHSHQMTQL